MGIHRSTTIADTASSYMNRPALPYNKVRPSGRTTPIAVADVARKHLAIARDHRVSIRVRVAYDCYMFSDPPLETWPNQRAIGTCGSLTGAPTQTSASGSQHSRLELIHQPPT